MVIWTFSATLVGPNSNSLRSNYGS